MSSQAYPALLESVSRQRGLRQISISQNAM